MSARTADVADVLDDEWLTTAEAAAYAKRAQITIRRAAALGVEHGGIKSTSAGRGRGRRYRRSWVDEWIHQPTRRTGRVS
jgi:hypothetical protein